MNSINKMFMKALLPVVIGMEDETISPDSPNPQKTTTWSLPQLQQRQTMNVYKK